MLKLFAILALLSQPAMAQDLKQEFEADAQACDKAADFAKCFERDRMQRALTDHATKLVIEELGRRLRPYREAVGRDRATRSRAIVELSNQGAPTMIYIAKLPRLLRKRSSWGPKDPGWPVVLLCGDQAGRGYHDPAAAPACNRNDPSHSWDIISWFYCPDAVGAHKHGGCAVDITNGPTIDSGGSRLGERHKSRSGLHVAWRRARRL